MILRGRLQTLLLSPLAILLLATVVIPAVILLSYSLYVWYALQPEGGLTLANFQTALTGRLYSQVAYTTLAVAGPATLLSVVGGYVLAYYAVFVQKHGRALMFALIVSAVMASYLARIFAWRTLLGDTGLLNSWLIGLGIIHQPLTFLLYSRPSAIFAMTALYMPLAALTFYAALSGISADYREAARDLGAGGLQALRRITLPLSGPALLTTTALIFFLACGDYFTPILVGGVDTLTVGRLISDDFGTIGDYGMGATLSFFMLTAFVAAYLLLRTLMRWTGLLPETIGNTGVQS